MATFQLWENIVLVSMETGHVEEVVRGVHRLLDLRGKYEDLQVLTLLVHTILHRQGLGDDDSEARYEGFYYETLRTILGTNNTSQILSRLKYSNTQYFSINFLKYLK